MADIVCISPVDGREVVRKPLGFSPREIAAARRRRAQGAGAVGGSYRLPSAARLCSAFVDAMLAMRADIAPELSWQMGRPVRYAGGELNGFEERARYMIGIADERAGAGRARSQKMAFRRYIRREPLGDRAHHRAMELSLSDRGQFGHSGADGRQRRAAQACRADHCWSATVSRSAIDRAGLPKGLFQTLSLSHDDTAKLIGSGESTRSASPARSPPAAPSSRRRPAPLPRVGLELGGKDPAYVRADANLDHAVENLVDGSFFNSGQCCCGIERIYVHAEHLRQIRRWLCRSHASIRARRSARSKRPRSGPWRRRGSRTPCASISARPSQKGARALIDGKAFKQRRRQARLISRRRCSSMSTTA